MKEAENKSPTIEYAVGNCTAGNDGSAVVGHLERGAVPNILCVR